MYWMLVFLSGALSIYFILLFYGSLNDYFLDYLFNSDSLYLPSIYQDLFVENGKVSSWVFNSSPNFVPDMLIYFPLNYLIGNFKLTTLFFSFLQHIILLALLFSLFRRFVGKHESSLHALVFLTTIIFILPYFAADDYYLSFLFLSNTFHFGTFIMALVSLNLALLFIERKSYFVLLMLMMVQIIAFLSDRLFLVLFTGPAFMTFALNFKNRQSLILAISQVVAASSGFFLFNNLKGFFSIHLSDPHRIFEFSYLFDSLDMMLQQIAFYFKDFNLVSIILILTLASFILTAIIIVRNYRSLIFAAKSEKILLYFLFSFFFVPAVIIAPILNGSYTGFDTVRYIVFALYLAIFNLPLIIWFYRSGINKLFFKLAPVVLFIVLLGYGVILTKKGNIGEQISQMANYYPEVVRNADNIAIQEGLKFGLANYWEAKHITMLSKSGLKIYAVHDDLVTFYHVSNRDWYYGCTKCEIGERKFNFIILNRFINRDVINHFMEEDHKIVNIEKIEMIITQPFVMNRKTTRPAIFEQ